MIAISPVVSSTAFTARDLRGRKRRCDVCGRAGEGGSCVPRAARAVVIDRRQYGCAKAPFCSLSVALRKLLHPHLRIHAKSNRPPVHSRPSVRTSVRTSLVSDNRSLARCTGAAAFFRPPGAAERQSIDSPGYKPASKVYRPAGILLSPA